MSTEHQEYLKLSPWEDLDNQNGAIRKGEDGKIYCTVEPGIGENGVQLIVIHIRENVDKIQRLKEEKYPTLDEGDLETLESAMRRAEEALAAFYDFVSDAENYIYVLTKTMIKSENRMALGADKRGVKD